MAQCPKGHTVEWVHRVVSITQYCKIVDDGEIDFESEELGDHSFNEQGWQAFCDECFVNYGVEADNEDRVTRVFVEEKGGHDHD